MSEIVKSIKSMKLYSHLERINNELNQLGIDESSPLDASDLSPFDNLHYHGADAVRRAISELRLTTEHRVLEIGSGLGGPARIMASVAGCHVTALEIQSDMDKLASELTSRCALRDQVTHICGDVLTYDLEPKKYDATLSWLAYYHIREHPTLFSRIATALKPEGMIYIEDLTALRPFSKIEQNLFRDKLYGQTAPSPQEYHETLTQAGFINISLTDQTTDWTQFTHNRLGDYRANQNRHIQIHGVDAYEEMEDFYSAVDTLFHSGCMGGIIIKAHLQK